MRSLLVTGLSLLAVLALEVALDPTGRLELEPRQAVDAARSGSPPTSHGPRAGARAVSPASAAEGAAVLRGSLSLPDELTEPAVARHLRLEMTPCEEPAERLYELPWTRMTAPDGVGERVRLFATRALPEGHYTLVLAPLGYHFPIELRAGGPPVDLVVTRPARTLVEAWDDAGAPIDLAGARALRFERDGGGGSAAALVLERSLGEVEVLSAPGRLHVDLPGREWWPRGGGLDVEPGWNTLTLRPRRAWTARVGLVLDGSAHPMPAEWWDRVAIEPLDGAGEVLARALGDVTRDGVASLVLRVSEAGRYRLRLPDTGLAPARSEVLRVDASGAREQEIQLALAGARDPRTR